MRKANGPHRRDRSSSKTIGKIRATVCLGDKEIRHIMHVVRDDFPVDYEGILGMDFLQKHKIRSDKKTTCKLTGQL